MSIYAQLGIFFIIVLAARQTGQFVQRARMPLITGYLLLGMLAGPYLLGMIPAGTPENLRFVDQISLGFIAFAAGSELYLAELRSRLRSIAWVTAGLVLFTFTLGTLATYALGSLIPFMSGLSPVNRLAISLLAGVILVARSPSSAIAIVNEMRAKGPFTKTALGVTVVMDVVVIVLFAVNASLVEGLLSGAGVNLGFIALLALELSLSILIGWVLSKLLHLILAANIPSVFKTVLLLLAGYSVFLLSNQVCAFCQSNLPFEVFIEPLLVCMLAGFLVANRTPLRDDFLQLIESTGPGVYVVFFTLTGAALNLDILRQTWMFALALFAVRLVGITLGSFSGGQIAGDPTRYNRIAWMAYITQAGVGLGLAKNVAVEFPEWGTAFATLIISVIVINQITGPPFFKIAIRRAGESHLPALAQPDEVRDALILGIEGQSLALARQLQAHNWQVTLADTDPEHVANAQAEGIEAYCLNSLEPVALKDLITPATDAVVAMLCDDDENYQALELAYEHFGTPRLIVRINDLKRAPEFFRLGAMVVNPATAMVSLFDTFVRAPQSAALLLHRLPDYDLLQVTLSDPDIAGRPLRALRLPADVLVIGISRDGHAIVPHGSTVMQLADEVTLVGEPHHLEEISLRFGY